MSPRTRYHVKVWLIRHWTLVSVGAGEVMFFGLWLPVAMHEPEHSAEIAAGAGVCGASWAAMYLMLRPPYTKPPTWRQARFTPGKQ
jgi:hypothetical protein